MGAEVPQHQVVVCAVARELVALFLERLGQRLRVGHHGLGVLLELWGVHLQQLRRECADLVVVGSPLQAREDGHVDALLDVGDGVRVLEENHACARASERLVGGGGHHVTVLEGRWVLSSGHEARDVRDVCHQERSDLVGDLAELGEIDYARVGRSPAQNHGGSEDKCRLAELVEINQASLVVHLVWQRLEVDRCRRDLLFRSVVAVGQMATAGKIQAHDARVRRQQCRVDGEVSRAAGVGLHVDAPLLRVQVERLESAVLAQVLDLVDDLVASVVARPRLALGVLVGERGSERLHARPGREVLRRDQLDRIDLPLFLLLDQRRHGGIRLLQALVAGKSRARRHLEEKLMMQRWVRDGSRDEQGWT
mmetsp:Transcript_123991/g.332958  ORF Transcript_123991/g.332958 Transcript_123991/m.332958 type:complete len:366 (-) Transcript_123991:23-1120(-)